MKLLSSIGNIFREVKSGFAAIADTEANLDGGRQRHIRDVVASVRDLLPTGELPVDALEKMISDHRRIPKDDQYGALNRDPEQLIETGIH